MANTAEMIKQAVEGIQSEVPALANLKMVIGLELRGRGDTQLYRVELPGLKVAKGYAEDERLHVSIPRSHFNELAADGTLKHWREAYARGYVKIGGDPEVTKLIGTVIQRHEARTRLKRVH